MDNLAKEIKNKIEKGDLKMKPKAYFMLGSFLATFGVIVFGTLTTFLVNVMFHRVRVGRVFPAIKGLPLEFKARMFTQLFPWEIFLLALGSLAIGLYLIRRFDVAYKKSFSYLVVLLVTVVLITAAGIDKSGINDRIKHKPYLRNVYKQRNVLGTQDFHRIPDRHKRRIERNLHPRLY